MTVVEGKKSVGVIEQIGKLSPEDIEILKEIAEGRYKPQEIDRLNSHSFSLRRKPKNPFELPFFRHNG